MYTSASVWLWSFFNGGSKLVKISGLKLTYRKVASLEADADQIVYERDF